MERNQLQMAMVATAGSANGAAANEGDARHGAPHDEAGAAPVRLDAMGPFSEWKKGAPCALFWAFYSLPEELWARGLLCPAECALMLGATSKGVRAALARLHRRVPATLRVVDRAGIEAVARGLVGLQGWCQVVRLDMKRGGRFEGSALMELGGGVSANGVGWLTATPGVGGGEAIGVEGARRLAEALRQCPSLTGLRLAGCGIRAEGAGILARVLGECPAIAELRLENNGMADEGALRLAQGLGHCSSLTVLNLADNLIGDEGAVRLAGLLGQCSSLAELDLKNTIASGMKGLGA